MSAVSEAKLTANQSNSQHSTGPKTEAGKRRSSLNAFRHGLTGQIHIATPEEMDAFRKHCETWREALAPIGILEIEAVQEIAEDRWRLKRARALENGIFAQGHREHIDQMGSGNAEVDTALAQSQTWLNMGKSLQLLTIYERRIKKSLNENEIQLKSMQEARKAAHAQALHEAILLTELAQSKGELYDPAPDFPPTADFGGFVYSTTEIARQLDRFHRLTAAQTARADQNPTSRSASKRN